MSRPDHLGGDIAGRDEATWFPDVWDWMLRVYGIRSALDVGCGDGAAIDWLLAHGVNAQGIDGVPRSSSYIAAWDFTQGPYPGQIDRFDMVWSCEFVEHVHERFLPNFLPALAAGRYLLMTHAEPGQAGHHHVNCRSSDYWIGALATVGMVYDEMMTSQARLVAHANPSPWNHFTRAGLCFRRILA